MERYGTGLTNGVFDVLHVGHVRYLQTARRYCERLIVAIDSDEHVRRIRGAERPVFTAQERAEVLAALQCVTEVVVFPESVIEVIERASPDVYFKGGDYAVDPRDARDGKRALPADEVACLRRVGSEIIILPFTEGVSTTAILERFGGREGYLRAIEHEGL